MSIRESQRISGTSTFFDYTRRSRFREVFFCVVRGRADARQMDPLSLRFVQDLSKPFGADRASFMERSWRTELSLSLEPDRIRLISSFRGRGLGRFMRVFQTILALGVVSAGTIHMGLLLGLDDPFGIQVGPYLLVVAFHAAFF
ncbi:MAG: hypothetical protein D6812_15145, partial [Deltaproteobacteria bacterium]